MRYLKVALVTVLAVNLLCVVLLETLLKLPSPGDALLQVYGGHPVYKDPAEAATILRDSFGPYMESAQFDDLLSFRYPPLKTPAVNVNADGDRELGVPAPSGAMGEVHLFGGSTLFGWGVRDDQTIAAYLQRLLPGQKVISHAQVSYTSFQELVQYQQILDRIPPNATVVFYDGKNDFWVGCWRSQQTRTIQSFRNELIWNQGRDVLRDPAQQWLGFFFRPIVSVADAVSGGPARMYAPMMAREKMRCADAGARAKIFSDLMANWESARAITLARGGHFLAFLHPHLAVTQARPAYLPTSLPDEGEAFRFLELYKEAAQTLRNKSLDWAIDLTRIYDYGGQDMILLDYSHPTPLGNRLAAQAIVTYLQNTTESTP